MLESSSVQNPDLADPKLIQQINKRLTLNLLIQGAAAHVYTTASHLVKDDLEEISEGLTDSYDRLAISVQLNYCIGDNALLWAGRIVGGDFPEHLKSRFATTRFWRAMAISLPQRRLVI
jgi:hypothetical protein